MNPRTSIMIFGLAVLILGMIPLIANFFPATSQMLENFPKAGTMTYQAILVIIGLLALILSGKKKQEKKRVRVIEE